MALSKMSGSSLRTNGRWKPQQRSRQTDRQGEKETDEEMVKEKDEKKKKTLALIQKPTPETEDTIQQ